MPGKSDRAPRTRIGHGQKGRRLGRPGPIGQERDPEPGRDEAAQRLDVLPFEGHPGHEARALAQLVDDCPQARLLAHRDEGVVGHLAEPHASPRGEAMVGGHGEAERLGHQLAPANRRIVGAGAGEKQIVAAAQELGEHDPGAALSEAEADMGMIGAVGTDQLGHEPCAQRVEEGKPNLAALRIAGFPHALETRVQLVQRA